MLLITNDFDTPPKEIIETYALRWLIENNLQENIDFFSLNALSSPIIVKVDFDPTAATQYTVELNEKIYEIEAPEAGIRQRDLLRLFYIKPWWPAASPFPSLWDISCSARQCVVWAFSFWLATEMICR